MTAEDLVPEETLLYSSLADQPPKDVPYIAVYNKYTGDIQLGASNQREDLLDELYATGDNLVTVCNHLPNWYSEYVDVETHELKERIAWEPIISTQNIRANGQDFLSISGIPSVASVEVVGPIYEQWVEDSGVVEITVDLPGEYAISIDLPTFMRVEVIFHAA